MNLGVTEVLVILGIVLLIFGPSRLPGLGKSMGQAIRGFKKGLNEDEAPAANQDRITDGVTPGQKSQTVSEKENKQS